VPRGSSVYSGQQTLIGALKDVTEKPVGLALVFCAFVLPVLLYFSPEGIGGGSGSSTDHKDNASLLAETLNSNEPTPQRRAASRVFMSCGPFFLANSHPLAPDVAVGRVQIVGLFVSPWSTNWTFLDPLSSIPLPSSALELKVCSMRRFRPHSLCSGARLQLQARAQFVRSSFVPAVGPDCGHVKASRHRVAVGAFVKT